MSEQTDPLLGAVLQDRYRVVQRLAAGGMGVVYRGERLHLERDVAIKFLHATYAAEPQAVKRFEREARALSRLSHPNCISIIDLGVEGAPYIVMDFVEGRTLREVMDEEEVSLARASNIARQMLAGLAHAHANGITHRDIKPANVMLTDPDGLHDHVLVLDFGLAKLRDTNASDQLTATSVLLGTPSYMAPELCRGETATAASDVYAAGVVIFELVTGAKPFEGENAIETLGMHKEARIPHLRDVAPERHFPPGLDVALHRALAKRPQDRFASAVELSDAIESVIGNSATAAAVVAADSGGVNARAATEISDFAMPVTAIPRPERKRSLVLAALALVLAPALALGWHGLVSRDDLASTAAPRDDAADSEPHRLVSSSSDDAPDDAADDEAVATSDDDEDEGDVEDEAEDADEPPLVDVPAMVFGEPDGEAEIDDDEPGGEIEVGVEDDKGWLAIVESADAEEEERADETESADTTPVTKIRDVEQLVKAGKREAAIAGIRKLRRQKKYRKNAYLLLMLGNLYFEKRWWGDGLDAYRLAIRHNRGYRFKPAITKNAITALGSNKTHRKASAILVYSVGRPSLGRLRAAARHNKSRLIRARAKWVAKQIRRRR